jgi:hypothetical protein
LKIPDETLKNICKLGQGNECCRYLACGADGLECLKNTSARRLLDERVESGAMNAMGDNCLGDGAVAQLDAKIWPWKPGDKGFLCMPMQKNIPNPRHSDWKLVECPNCGNGCWESDQRRELLKNNLELKAMCTECALVAGIKGRGD